MPVAAKETNGDTAPMIKAVKGDTANAAVSTGTNIGKKVLPSWKKWNTTGNNTARATPQIA